MFVAGDTVGRSQRGNNNAYCQDNEISWIPWDLRPDQEAFFDFVTRVVQLRREHPAFHRRSFFQGRHIKGSGVKDILWLKPDGTEMSDDEWTNSYAQCLGMFVAASGLDERDRQGRRLHDDNFVVLFNAYHQDMPFTLPAWESDRAWEVVLDSAADDRVDRRLSPGAVYPLSGRSMAVLRLTRSNGVGRGRP
jgi:glycogen operon protein